MNIGSICTRRMIAVDSSSTLAQAAGLMIRSGIEREVAESRGDPQPPKPMPLRVPAVGHRGLDSVTGRRPVRFGKYS